MGKKSQRIVIVLLGYWFTSASLAFVMTLVSVSGLTQKNWQLEKYAAIIARAGLLPYTILNKPFHFATIETWNSGLLLLQDFPLIAQPVQKLWNQYETHQNLDKESFKILSLHTENLIKTYFQFSDQLKHISWLENIFQSKELYQEATNNPDLEAFIQFLQLLLKVTAHSIQQGERQQFLILFQNNMELRASGGFPGSYAVISLADNQPIQFQVEDIYVPDGQLEGHVDPPQPIQEAFQQGFWKLRDANWHPDFPSSAQLVQWFFKEGVNQEFDGVIAINFSTIHAVLEITGPIYVPDYDQTISTDNVYQFLQRTDGDKFFAGSTKKKDVLNAFSTQLLLTMNSLSLSQKIKLLNVLTRQLKEKNIMMTFENPDLNSFLFLKNWDGHLQVPDCSQEGCHEDYFSIFEANLGVNKANCCVTRSVDIKKTIHNNTITTVIDVTYQHKDVGEQYHTVTGDYKAFVRAYFPNSTQIDGFSIQGISESDYIRELKSKGFLHPITHESYSTDTVFSLKELGFWLVVPTNDVVRYQIKTTTQLLPNQPYQLNIQKQPGTLEQLNQFNIELNERSLFKGTLQFDTEVQ